MSYTEKQRNLFGLALSIKRGEQSLKDVKNNKSKIKELLKRSQKELEDMASKPGSVEEMTTSASSGSYETPIKFIDRNMDLKESLTIEDLTYIVKEALIKEEVFSEKPPTKKGTETGSPQKTYGSKAGKNTDSSQKRTKKTNEKSVKMRKKKVADNEKDNLKGQDESKEPKKEINRKLTDEEKAVARAGGMEDLEYDNKPSKEWKEDQKKNMGKDVTKKAKTLKKKRDKAKEPFVQSGGDIEFPKKGMKKKSKSLAVENTIKRFKFKKPFLTESVMKNKIPSKSKKHMNVFEMFDTVNRYQIRWEGNSVDGYPVVLEHVNLEKKKVLEERVDKLFNKKVITSNSKSSNKNENIIFKNMLNKLKSNV